jgi:hypothetical protein
VLITDSTGRRALDGCGRSRVDTHFAPARSGDRCQLWRFIPAADGYSRIVSVRGARALAGSWRLDPHNDSTYDLVDQAGRDLGTVQLRAP